MSDQFASRSARQPAIAMWLALSLLLSLLLSVSTASAHDPRTQKDPYDPHEHHVRTQPLGPAEPYAAEAQSRNVTRFSTWRSAGFNADIWVHRSYAYLGSWGIASNYPSRCPAKGVRIVDLTTPREPKLAATVAVIPGTSTEDVVVRRIKTAAFEGDLLVTGVQACQRTSTVKRGIDLWDVTDPRAEAPRFLVERPGRSERAARGA